jgi:hypothetical protein
MLRRDETMKRSRTRTKDSAQRRRLLGGFSLSLSLSFACLAATVREAVLSSGTRRAAEPRRETLPGSNRLSPLPDPFHFLLPHLNFSWPSPCPLSSHRIGPAPKRHVCVLCFFIYLLARVLLTRHSDSCDNFCYFSLGGILALLLADPQASCAVDMCVFFTLPFCFHYF